MEHEKQYEYKHKEPFVGNGVSTPLFPTLQMLGIVDDGIMDTLLPSLSSSLIIFWKQSQLTLCVLFYPLQLLFPLIVVNMCTIETAGLSG